MKHFTIFDYIFSALLITICLGFCDLARTAYNSGEYIWSVLWLACIVGVCWLVYGWVRGNRESWSEDKVEN